MSYISGAIDRENTDAVGDDPVVDVDEEAIARDRSAEAERESAGCVFCDRIRQPQASDRANLILLRAKQCFVILNLYPYNSAHLMVVPYEHTADFAGLDAGTLSEMTTLAQDMVRMIGEEYQPEGYNLGMNLGRAAGAGVADHLHLHVVPRWAGDTNFMPVVGATKVMPELLGTTYDRLKARLQMTE